MLDTRALTTCVVPDCLVLTLSSWLEAACLLGNLHQVLHRPLRALGLPLHHLAVILSADLSFFQAALGYG